MLHGCGRPRPFWLTSLVAAIIVSLGSAGSAGAETKTWGGGIGSSWHTGSNWSPAGVPGEADDVVIASGRPLISAGDAVAGSIDVNSGLDVSGGRRLTVGDTAPSTIAADINLSEGDRA